MILHQALALAVLLAACSPDKDRYQFTGDLKVDTTTGESWRLEGGDWVKIKTPEDREADAKFAVFRSAEIERHAPRVDVLRAAREGKLHPATRFFLRAGPPWSKDKDMEWANGFTAEQIKYLGTEPDERAASGISGAFLDIEPKLTTRVEWDRMQ